MVVNRATCGAKVEPRRRGLPLCLRTRGPANGSDAEPRSGSTFQPRDAKRRAKRAAEAAGQRTPLRRLLQRVSRPFSAEPGYPEEAPSLISLRQSPASEYIHRLQAAHIAYAVRE